MLDGALVMVTHGRAAGRVGRVQLDKPGLWVQILGRDFAAKYAHKFVIRIDGHPSTAQATRLTPAVRHGR